jgi:hypothetical protein
MQLASSTTTALRLTVAGVVLSRYTGHNAITCDIPEEVCGGRFIWLQFQDLNPTLIVNGLPPGPWIWDILNRNGVLKGDSFARGVNDVAGAPKPDETASCGDLD